MKEKSKTAAAAKKGKTSLAQTVLKVLKLTRNQHAANISQRKQIIQPTNHDSHSSLCQSLQLYDRRGNQPLKRQVTTHANTQLFA